MTAADADFAGSATLTAVTVTVAGLGTDEGALYSPLVLIVPVDVLPPATPFTFQVTCVLVLPETVAVNC